MSQIKKISNKQVKVKDVQNLGGKEIHLHNRFQLFVCKLFKITPATAFRYNLSVKYYGTTRLKPKDIVTDSQGNIYTVLHENNRVARMFNYNPLRVSPNISGVLKIEGRKPVKK